MTRAVSWIVGALSVAAPLLALTACPAHDQGFPVPPPEPDDQTVISAADTQITDAESKGWSPSDDRAFSARLAELSMPKRLELGQRLAREISLGKIKLKRAPRAANGAAAPGARTTGSAGGTTPGAKAGEKAGEKTAEKTGARPVK